MRRRVIIVFCALSLAFLAGLWVAGRDTFVQAQSVTPAPWLSVAGPFEFCYNYPGMVGCALAEDKTGDRFVNGWKVDVDRARADCLRWGAVGTLPAAYFTLDPLCSGGARLVGGIYWFAEPVVGTPTPPTPAATVSEPPFTSPPASSLTPTPFPTSGMGTPTVTPSATRPPPMVTPGGAIIPTLSPAQKRAFSTYCDLSGQGYGMTIWGSYGLTYNVPDEWCAPVRDANEELLRRMREATVTWIRVRP